MTQELQPVPKKVLPIIYVIDTSGSMEGERIACLNAVMREALRILEKGTSNDYYYDIRIAVLQFGSSVRWVTGDEMIPLEDYFWEDLEASGVTNLGDALIELSDKLNNERLLKDCKNGFIWPRIFFITDGYPTDDWETALEYADKNRLFQRSCKLALGIGDDFSKEALIKIVGDKERVLFADSFSAMQSCVLDYVNGALISPYIDKAYPTDDSDSPPPSDNDALDWINDWD